MKKRNFIGIILLFLVTITGCDCTKNPLPPPPPVVDTQAPTVPTGLAGVATTSSVSLSWTASTDNVAVTGYKIFRGGTQISTSSSTTYTDNGLTPNTPYSYTVSAYDAAGNNSGQSSTLVVTTNPLPNQNSAWFAQPTVTIATPVAGMIGNTVNNDILIILINNAAVAKTATFSLNFGASGSAVKMLRYQSAIAPDGTGWTLIPASGGTVTFSNFVLQSGTTTLKARFALKENVGVANGSSLSISFSSLNDGEGMTMPIGGSWQAPVAAGTVDANTQATKLTTEWLGYMFQTNLVLAPSGTGTVANYNVTNVKVVGPGSARVAFLKLRNPYGDLITFDNTSWLTNVDGTGYAINQSNITWSSDYVKIVMPSQAIISNSGFTSLFLRCGVSNPGSNTFNSGNITPGLYGLELKTKYDLEILNSNGQVIDLSDVFVKQGSNIVSN